MTTLSLYKLKELSSRFSRDEDSLETYSQEELNALRKLCVLHWSRSFDLLVNPTTYLIAGLVVSIVVAILLVKQTTTIPSFMIAALAGTAGMVAGFLSWACCLMLYIVVNATSLGAAAAIEDMIDKKSRQSKLN